MAVAYLSSSVIATGIDADTTPLSASVTVDASANYAVVAVQWGNDISAGTISSVTLGGNAMTSLGAASTATLGGFPTGIQLFGLVSPPTGSQTLTINFSVAPFTAYCTAAYFSGVDTTTPTEGFQTTTGTGTAVNAGVTTTTVADDLILGHVMSQVAAVTAISTADTQITETDISAFADIVAAVAYQNISGSGAQVNWTNTSSVPFRAQAIAITAAATGSTGTSATTNATDTSAASGTTTIVGTSANTNVADVSAASGTTTIVGTSATTNAVDTSDASGSVGGAVAGTSATTNAPDVSDASGNVGIVCSADITENGDVCSAVGVVTDNSVISYGGWSGGNIIRPKPKQKEQEAEHVQEIVAEVAKAVLVDTKAEQQKALKDALKEQEIAFKQAYFDELNKQLIKEYMLAAEYRRIAIKNEEETIVFMMMALA